MKQYQRFLLIPPALNTIQFKLISLILVLFLFRCQLNRTEISEKCAASKKSKQILGGCYLGAFTPREVEEIRNSIPKRECLLPFPADIALQAFHLSRKFHFSPIPES